MDGVESRRMGLTSRLNRETYRKAFEARESAGSDRRSIKNAGAARGKLKKIMIGNPACGRTNTSVERIGNC